MEKDIIKKFFPGMQPRPIKFICGGELDGKAGTNLEIRVGFIKKCTRDDLIKLLTHELIHYWVGPQLGHNQQFLDECERLGLEIEDFGYEINQYVVEGELFGEAESRFIDGKEHIIRKKRPTWKIFEQGPLYDAVSQGPVFRSLRHRYGLSQKDVAQEAKISISLLRLIERAKEVNHPWGHKNPIRERYLGDNILKRLFHAIVRLGEKRNRKK